MRLTSILYRQHIGFFFKKHWLTQGKRTPLDTGAENYLAKAGIPVVDPKDLLTERRKPIERVEVVGDREPAIKFDETHPQWKSEICYLYKDSNVLLEGVKQAQNLLNTLELNEYPANIEERLAKIQIPVTLDRSMQQSVLSSHLFDAEQVKLHYKAKDPNRPAFNFPRLYGISPSRKCNLVVLRFLNHCEKLAGHDLVKGRKFINNAFFITPLTKNEELIQFELHADTFMVMNKPLTPALCRHEDADLPNIFPLKETISIPTTNIYDSKCFYPIHKTTKFTNPHTIFINHAPENVRNLFDGAVTMDQIESRSLIKAFTTAAAKAQQLYGKDIKVLPEPITVQVVHTNASFFHFSIFQLNTLDLNSQENGKGLKNLWFNKPKIDLFAECDYKVGKPVMSGYNKDVFRHFQVFYNSV